MVVPAVPLVSFVSVAVSVMCFGDSSASGVIGICIGVYKKCFHDSSTSGVLGVCGCICEVLW